MITPQVLHIIADALQRIGAILAQEAAAIPASPPPNGSRTNGSNGKRHNKNRRRVYAGPPRVHPRKLLLSHLLKKYKAGEIFPMAEVRDLFAAGGYLDPSASGHGALNTMMKGRAKGKDVYFERVDTARYRLVRDEKPDWL